MEEYLPVSVLTGFLGSGKTTLLGKLLLHPDMADTAVIINEFGAIGLDHHLVVKSDDNTVLLNSGCLCCTIRGDLVDTLRTLFLQRVRGEVPEFKRVVIETTGLADPAPILHTLMSDPILTARYRLDGVITTVDAVNGAGTLDRQMESVKQAAVADRILLTKSDIASAESMAALTARLKRLNPAAPILPVIQGVIAPSAILAAGLYDPSRKTMDVQGWLKAEAYQPAKHDHSHDHDHHHGHNHSEADGGPDRDQDPHDPNRHDARIRAFCLTIDHAIEWNALAYWLDLLANYRGDDLLRVKGIIHVAGYSRPVVIHGVQHLFHPPVELPAWPDDNRQSRIVFITRDISQETIEQTLHAMIHAPAP